MPNTRAHRLCAFAYLVLLLGCRAQSTYNEERAALGDYRPYRARFTTSLGYAPCKVRPLVKGSTGCGEDLPGVAPLTSWDCSPRPLPRSPASSFLRKASTALSARADRDHTPEADFLKAANIELLRQGDARMAERAADWLRRGLQIASDRQPFLADLGAVHLVLAELTGKTEELLHSVEYSEQALQELPSAEAPRYNLALALTLLGLTSSARIEWQRFLEVTPPSLWAAEARRWLSSIPPSAGDSLKKDITARLSAAVYSCETAASCNYAAIIATGRENRQLTREWIETELLRNWAEAWLKGNKKSAALLLAGARILAVDLATSTGDHLLVDATKAISEGTESQRDQLAHGHLDFSQGIQQIPQRPEMANKLLFQAEHRFRVGRSPFVLWARFHLARLRFVDQQFQSADAALALLAQETNATRYPVLTGRAHWIHGLVTSNLGRIEESNSHYRMAAATFCTLREEQNLAATQGLLAAAMHKIGHYESAWSLTRSALERRGSIYNRERLQAILQDAANNADRQGLLRSGLHFADEFVSVVERDGYGMNLYNALIRRAALREALGQSAGAKTDLEEAEQILKSLPSKTQGERASADGVVERARRNNGKAPTSVLMEGLNEAIAHYRKTSNLQKLPQAYALRARGHLEKGNFDQAEADLNAESRILENTHFATSPGPLRQDRILVLQEFFDQMIEFQAATRHDSAAAFRFSERQRHWALWEWARTAAPATGRSRKWGEPLDTASWSDLQAMGTSDTAILAYHVLPHQILLWASGPNGSTMVTVTGDRRAIQSEVAALVTAANQRDMKTLRSSASALNGILIAPVASWIREASLLVVVPDRVLQELPFGLLLDTDTDRFLWENHALVFSPSATAFTKLSRAATRSTGETSPRLLAVAATRGPKARLNALPATIPEAAAVAAQWRSGQAASFREKALLDNQLSIADAFHFAGHAIEGPESLRLVLHDDTESPLQLTAADIVGDRFPKLRLVSLSGCRTADVGPASQTGSLSAGFVRSFLAADVSTVVASFLDLKDSQAQGVFPAFYHRLARCEDPARALRQVCMEQPIRSQADRALLCGSLAVYGISSPVTGNCR